MRIRPFFFTAAGALLLAACAAPVPRLHAPDGVEVYCGDRAAVATAIESIVASTGDATEPPVRVSEAQIRKDIQSGGGIVAHWNDQQLYQPSLAKTLGADGKYVTLGDALISNRPTSTDSRPIFLALKTPSGSKLFALRAYDVQDVCNQGKRSS